MPKKNLLVEMKANPKADWSIRDVQRLCKDHNAECRPPSRGSHYKIMHGAVPEEILTIPAHKPIKAVYIRMLVDLISRALGES